MTKEGKLFKKHMEQVDEEIAIIAGKPLDQLTDKEKSDVIVKWTLTRNAPNKKPSVGYRILSLIVYVTAFGVFACLLLLVLKWFFKILGVI
jgi:hypothetical protein